MGFSPAGVVSARIKKPPNKAAVGGQRHGSPPTLAAKHDDNHVLAR